MLKHLLVEVFRLDGAAFGYIICEKSGLEAPLREVINALQSLHDPQPPEQQGLPRQRSIGGGRVARMLQSYVLRLRGSAGELGQRAADELSAQAHALLAQMDEAGPSAQPVPVVP